MIEVKFCILRFFIDAIFVGLLFFGFLCGIHYGTILTGLHFTFMKVGFGICGIGIMLYFIKWFRTVVAGMLKSCSIYASARECASLCGAFKGIVSCLGSTLAVPAFNRIIRDALQDIKDAMTDEASNPAKEALAEVKESRLGKVSVLVVERAFDYVDECILGYCYKNVSENHGIAKCSVEAFTLFLVNSVEVMGKVFTVISLESLVRIAYWFFFIVFCLEHFHFTVLNVLMCYVIGKCLDFMLDDALFEPLLVHVIVNEFLKFSWDESFEKDGETYSSSIPALKRIIGMFNESAGGDDDGSC